MFLVRTDGHDVARPYFFDRSAPALVESASEGDDQRLPERMGMPVASRARLEADVRARRPRRLWRLEQRVDANGPGKMLGRCLLRRLRAAALDLHGYPRNTSTPRSWCELGASWWMGR